MIWVLATGAVVAGEPFTLVDGQGRSIEVEVEKVTLKEVTFERNGRKTGLLLSRLEPGNQEKLVQMAKKKAIYHRYPKLIPQVAVRDKDARKSGSSYMRSLWLTPQLTLDSDERLEPIAPLKATIQVICADTEALYARRKKEYAIRVKDTLEIPAAKNGDRRSFDFKTFKLEFDEDRDSSNTGGWIYRYWILTLRDPESNAVVQWKTNFGALEKHIEEWPEERDKYLNKGIGKIPSKFEDPEVGGGIPTLR